MAGAIDIPIAYQSIQAAGFLVAGWAYGYDNPVSRIELFLAGGLLGRAGLGRPRPDVAQALGEPGAEFSGFELLVAIPPSFRSSEAVSLQIAVTRSDGAIEKWPPVSLSIEATPEAPLAPLQSATIRATVPQQEPIRVLWFARSLDQGGSQLRMAELIEHLYRIGGFVSTVLSTSEGPLRTRLESAGATVGLAPHVALNDPVVYEQHIATLCGQIDGNFDLVVGSTVTSFPAVDAAIRAGVPSVLRIGEAATLPSVVQWLGGNLSPVLAALALRTVSNATAVWCNSHAAVRTYRQSGLSARFTVLGSGVDAAAARAYLHSRDRAQSRKQLGIEPEERLLVCVGTLWPIKAQALLVQALQRIHLQYPKLRCVFIGVANPVYADAIDRFVLHHGLDKVVQIVAFCDDLRPWWQAADAAVCCSESESLPAAVVEAMAFELPVLATRVGDLPELIEPGITGWLCVDSDLDALTRCLVALATTSQTTLRNMGLAAADAVARLHDRKTSFDCTVEMLHAAATGHSAAIDKLHTMPPGSAKRRHNCGYGPLHVSHS